MSIRSTLNGSLLQMMRCAVEITSCVNTKTVIIIFNLSGSENIYLVFVNYHNKSQVKEESHDFWTASTVFPIMNLVKTLNQPLWRRFLFIPTSTLLFSVRVHIRMLANHWEINHKAFQFSIIIIIIIIVILFVVPIGRLCGFSPSESCTSLHDFRTQRCFQNSHRTTDSIHVRIFGDDYISQSCEYVGVRIKCRMCADFHVNHHTVSPHPSH